MDKYWKLTYTSRNSKTVNVLSQSCRSSGKYFIALVFMLIKSFYLKISYDQQLFEINGKINSVSKFLARP